jgi:predicted DCC family thiol-disulfide oxidoreductase YuxK
MYDGVCGLCNRLNQFVLPRDPTAVFLFVSLQSEAARSVLKKFGKNPDDLDTFYVLADYKSDAPRLYDRSRAALFVLNRLQTPWKLLKVAELLPNFVLDLFYRLLARNRYRIFGRSDQCLLPNAEYANRFMETRTHSDGEPRL